MRRRDWLLLCIGERLEPIQIQKTLFKFAMESGGQREELYQFEPYNWGPCSFSVYDDLRTLREEGLLEIVPPGRGWNYYTQTDAGRLFDTASRKTFPVGLLAKLDEAREFVTTRSFDELLRDVYSVYPEYASRSLFAR